MPPRVARSNLTTSAPKNAKNKSRKRNLDAYSIASHSIEPSKIAAHRLGELVDDAPRHKRRRTDDDDEVDSDDEDLPQRNPLKPHGRGPVGNGDDDVEQGSDSEGNEWTLGGLAEDDEDSDLDSDEAFGESDEERFEGFTFRGSRSTKSRAGKPPRRRNGTSGEEQMDLEEDEPVDDDDEEEDDFGDEGVDLATMLDDEQEEGDADEEEGSDEIDGDNIEAASESDDETDDVDEADDAERYARFRDRLEALDPTLRGEDQVETAMGSTGLTMEDLLDDMDPSEKKQILSTIKPKRKSQRAERLTAPLPKRQQDRLNREVASQKAKEQLDRWRDTVIHNRRAEFLSFPLVDPSQPNPVGKDKFIINEEPGNELEESIKKIMEESGMVSKAGQAAEVDEAELLKAEALATKDLPVEEVMRRRAELRRARDLLFREEIKAKRIAKIKSKSYRRVHRKERLRLAEAERMAQEMEGPGEEDEEQREKHDRRRALERMSTRHRDSKFAKALKATNRSVWDDEARNGVIEQVRRREELTKRIAGQDADRSDGHSEDDESVGEDDEPQRYLKRLDEEEEERATNRKGLAEMGFMRAADERRRARNAEDIERLRKEMAVEDGDEDASEDEDGDDHGISRVIFGPKAKLATQTETRQKRPELEEGDESEDEVDDSNGALEPNGAIEGIPKSNSKQKSNGNFKNGRESGEKVAKNGTRDRRTHTSQQQKRDGDTVSALLRSPSPPAQGPPLVVSSLLTAPKPEKSRRSRNDRVEVVMELLDDPPDEPSVKTRQHSKKGSQDDGPVQTSSKDGDTKASDTTTTTSGWQTIAFTSNDDSDAQDEDAQTAALPVLTPAEQRAALLDRAFAGGDDSAATFAAEKDAAIASEDEHEVSTHLPGWGSWTGEGLSKSLRKQNKKKAHNPLFKHKLPGVKAENRKDKGMSNVIISEKTDRKGKKYLAPVLPHEFERKDQYERSLRVPVGPEWTTKEVFQRGTRPRVVVKPGVVVAPMERPLL